jgi:hypothetical protein
MLWSLSPKFKGNTLGEPAQVDCLIEGDEPAHSVLQFRCRESHPRWNMLVVSTSWFDHLYACLRDSEKVVTQN